MTHLLAILQRKEIFPNLFAAQIILNFKLAPCHNFSEEDCCEKNIAEGEAENGVDCNTMKRERGLQ